MPVVEILRRLMGRHTAKAIATGERGRRGRFVYLFLTISTVATTVSVGLRPAHAASGPYRAADITAWYPDEWLPGQPHYPNTLSHPSRGFYKSADVAPSQVDDLVYARIDVGVYELKQGGIEDSNLAAYLNAARGKPVKFAAMWSLPLDKAKFPSEQPTLVDAVSFMTYIKNKYASDANYFHWSDGRPVLWMYFDMTQTCASRANDVLAAKQTGFYLAIRYGFVDPTLSCPENPDALFGWDPFKRTIALPDAFTISPGYNVPPWWPYQKHLDRDVNAWATAVQQMNASTAPWHLITTYCSWDESTTVESAAEWASSSGYGQYLDVLHST